MSKDYTMDLFNTSFVREIKKLREKGVSDEKIVDIIQSADFSKPLLEIVQKYSEEEYGKVIEERQSWPVLYHLSHIRENIVDWIPMTKDMKVLEVGSGCGAITGALARKAGSVTCVDLSKKRSTINATRHKNCDNVTIHVGNFKPQTLI